MIDEIAQRAYKIKDSRLLKEMAYAHQRLLNIDKYTYWEYKYIELLGDLPQNHWDGADLSNTTLWISFKDTEKQGIALGMNLVGYVKYVSTLAKHTTLVVDKRLVQIFSRTLPDVEVVSGPANPVARNGTRLVTANPLILRKIMCVKESDLIQFYSPFIPNKDDVENFRLKYRKKNPKNLLFGITWGSFSPLKRKVPIDLWINLVKSINVTFVVIQYKYDGFDYDLKRILGAAPNRVILDKSVNQLIDMDNFASQLSSLDVIVGSGCSDTYFAGALGIDTYTIGDDLFRSSAPVRKYNKVFWYPNLVHYGKSGRNWTDVFTDLMSGLVDKYGKSIIIDRKNQS